MNTAIRLLLVAVGLLASASGAYAAPSAHTAGRQSGATTPTTSGRQSGAASPTSGQKSNAAGPVTPKGAQRGGVYRIKDLATADPARCRDIMTGLTARHDQTILELEDVFTETLDQPGRVASTMTAIHLLGRFRAAHSVGLLAEHIAYTPRKNGTGTGPGRYPCLGALATIGSPALDPVVDQVVKSTDPLTPKLAAYVLVKVLGRHLATDLVDDKLATADPASKPRLNELKNTLQSTTADSSTDADTDSNN
jgi:hypothetical protein